MAILLVDIVAIAVIASSLYPFAAGKFNVDLPDASEVSWRVEGGDLFLTAPVRVTNGGIFDVSDLRVDVFLADDAGRTILDQTQRIERIPSGVITTIPFGFTVDLDGLLAQGIDDLVFEPTNLSARITAGATYTMGLVRVGVDYPFMMPWEPLIVDYGVLESGISYTPQGSGTLLSVPFYLVTSSILQGTVQVDLALSNASGLLTSTSTSLVLGGSTVGTLQFPLSNQTLWGLATQSQLLTAEAVFTFSGISVTQRFGWDWGAPFSGFALGTPQIAGSELRLPVSFTNEASLDLDLAIAGTVVDSSQQLVSTTSQSLQVPQGSPAAFDLVFSLPPGGLRPGETYTLTLAFTDRASGMGFSTGFSFEGS